MKIKYIIISIIRSLGRPPVRKNIPRHMSCNLAEEIKGIDVVAVIGVLGQVLEVGRLEGCQVGVTLGAGEPESISGEIHKSDLIHNVFVRIKRE